MIVDQPGGYRNSGIINTGATIATGGVTLTNGSGGRILGSGVTLTTEESTFINELGAEVGERNSFAWYPNVLVQGSSGTDTIINAGLVFGQVRLGEGDDSFVDRNGLVQGSGWGIYLEGGDDILRLEGADGGRGAIFANGGDGYDTVVVAATGGDPRRASLFGFEQLILESGGNINGYSGFHTIVLASTQPFAFYNFIGSRNATADLFLSAGQQLAINSSEFRSITGSDGSDAVQLASSGFSQVARVLNNVQLGGGNDRFTIDAYNGGMNPVVGGFIDGGEGLDSFDLIVSNSGNSGGAINLDLNKAVGFEKLFVNIGYNYLNPSVALKNLTGFQTIQAGEMTNLALSSARLPSAELRGAAGGSVILDSDVVIGSYSAFRFDPVSGSPAETEANLSSSVTFINNGTIEASIRFAGGVDLYDGRQGSVGGIVDGGAGDDRLLGGLRADHLVGGTGDDVLEGGGGDDVLTGGAGADQIRGGTGNDVIAAIGDGDQIDGGLGYDTVKYDGLAHAYSVTAGGMGASVALGRISDKIAGTEGIQFRDATLTFDENSNAAFVMRLYDSAFDRVPEALGLDYWVEQLDANVSRSTIANIFLQTPEFAAASGTLSTRAFAEFLYIKVLGRAPEAGGVAYWSSQIDSGLSRGDALLAFSESAEHRVLTASTLANGLWVTDNDYQQVAALYDAFADRLPDLAGLNYWVGQVKGGTPIEQVADSFVKSQEFVDKTYGFSSSQVVDFFYGSALNRSAEPGGRAYWAQELDAGLSKGELLLNIGLSAEHFQLLEHQLFSGVDYLI